MWINAVPVRVRNIAFFFFRWCWEIDGFSFLFFTFYLFKRLVCEPNPNTLFFSFFFFHFTRKQFYDLDSQSRNCNNFFVILFYFFFSVLSFTPREWQFTIIFHYSSWFICHFFVVFPFAAGNLINANEMSY